MECRSCPQQEVVVAQGGTILTRSEYWQTFAPAVRTGCVLAAGKLKREFHEFAGRALAS